MVVAGMYWHELCQPDTECLQDNGHLYPTLLRIALDFLACQGSSVPCKHLFSGGGEIATKWRAQLGAEHFEELQVMKFAWKKNIGDLATWNSSQVEEVYDEIKKFHDFLAVNREQEIWDDAGVEVVIE